MEIALIAVSPIGYLLIARGTYGLFHWQDWWRWDSDDDYSHNTPDGIRQTHNFRMTAALLWPVAWFYMGCVVTGHGIRYAITGGWADKSL